MLAHTELWQALRDAKHRLEFAMDSEEHEYWVAVVQTLIKEIENREEGENLC